MLSLPKPLPWLQTRPKQVVDHAGWCCTSVCAVSHACLLHAAAAPMVLCLSSLVSGCRLKYEIDVSFQVADSVRLVEYTAPLGLAIKCSTTWLLVPLQPSLKRSFFNLVFLRPSIDVDCTRC
jgi:hypothetical protein